MWESGRRGLRLLESFLPLLIGAPLIVLVALWGSFRALAPGGEMDRGYDNVGGALVLSGERNGRPVSIRLGGEERTGASEVSVAAPAAEFSAKSRDGRVRPGDSAPEAVVAALKGVHNSTRWKKVTIAGVRRASRSPARAASSPIGSATSGSPNGSPELENGPCTRLRSEASRRVRRIWLEPGSPAAPAASA